MTTTPIHPNVLRGYERTFDNMRAATTAAEKRAARAEQEVAFWTDAWETLLGDLADLVTKVEAKPKARRHATLRELKTIIKRQAEPCADEPLRNRDPAPRG